MDSTITTTLYSMYSSPKVLAYQVYHRLNPTHKFQKIQAFFILSLISLFSLYFLTTKSTNFIWFFAFFAFVIISLTLALPNPTFSPTQPLPIHVSLNKPTQNSTHSVVWSIGSDPKWEKVQTTGFLVKGFGNGDVYEGEMCMGKFVGSGVYCYNMCGKYEGDWVNGKYEGYGVEMWLKGSQYRGQYRNGLRNGFGVYKFFSGDVFGGEWLNGNCHGCGVYISMDGCDRYVGEFKWGVKHGFGHYRYRNGDVYAGEYFADKMHGFGVYKFGNGHQYEGSWHEGRSHGFGEYTFGNGTVRSGYWQNGILDAASNRIGLSASSFQDYSTQVSDAVKKAREASQRSYNVAIADDRVSKAVVSANAAANAARLAAVKAVQQKNYEEINNNKCFINWQIPD